MKHCIKLAVQNIFSYGDYEALHKIGSTENISENVGKKCKIL